MNQKPLLEIIRENIRNGELPDSFSLSKEDSDPNKVKWADGAYDGVSIFHMGRPEITDEHMEIVADAFSAIQDHERAKARMKSFFAKISPLWGIDAIQNYIFSHTDSLPAAAVHQFAMECIQSSDVDLVKLGMLIIEIFSEPDNTIKDIIRTLGLSDEFTIFAVFNMLTWQNANEEVFALVKKVHGWGRIHAIERLSPDTQEIKDWLLAEGIRNNVVPAYSALEVFRKADVSALLQSKITDTQLDQTAGVLYAMFDEGPVRGISTLSENDADAVIDSMIRQAESNILTLRICELLLTISKDERFSAHAEQCSAILQSERCRTLIEQELTHGKGVELAQEAGIPYKEKIFAYMHSDFEKGFSNCGFLIHDEQYRESVVDLFRNALPIQCMLAESNDLTGNFADYSKLSYLLHLLNSYPLCGTDLVLAALRMPFAQCRIQALKTASEWCKSRDCALSVLSEELSEAVEQLKASENNENVLRAIEQNGF